MEEKTIKWSVNHEEIFTEWADKAFCYSWMHNKSSIKYNKLQNLFTIPVIIMSTLTGTANFAIERVPKQYQSSIQICIGAVNMGANLVEKKNLHVVLEIAMELTKLNFILVGDGPKKAHLANKIKDLKLSNTQILGFKNHKELVILV